jgi:hypothetical protein
MDHQAGPTGVTALRGVANREGQMVWVLLGLSLVSPVLYDQNRDVV